MIALRADPTEAKGVRPRSLVLAALDVIDSNVWENIVARVAAVHVPLHVPADFAAERRGV